VNVGMARTRFEARGRMSVVRSRAAIIMISDARKAVSSSVKPIWLVTLTPIP